MTKKIAIITTTAVIILAPSIFIGSGFNKRTDVVLSDYSVSDDGMKLTLNTDVISSMGYTRGFKDIGGQGKSHNLTFYSTFGGFNTSFLAKNEFVLDLNEDDREIYFNRADGKYELVLQKDSKTGEWIKP